MKNEKEEEEEEKLNCEQLSGYTNIFNDSFLIHFKNQI